MATAPPPPPPPLRPLTSDLSGGLHGLLVHEKNASASPGGIHVVNRKITNEDALEEMKRIAKVELERFRSVYSVDLNDSEGDDRIGMVVYVSPMLEPVLQCGPVCGLVALVEAAQILGINVSPDAVLEDAILKGMTMNGEIFSVAGMKALADHHVKVPSRIISMYDGDMSSGEICVEFCRRCIQGNPVLVPYDADYNHSPTQRKGHSAHWAVIHGIAVAIPVSKIKDILEETLLEDASDDIFILTLTKFNPKLTRFLKSESLFVVAHQGKSVHAALWKYNELMQSNQNLKEAHPKLLVNPGEFIIGDVKTELSSQFIIFEER